MANPTEMIDCYILARKGEDIWDRNRLTLRGYVIAPKESPAGQAALAVIRCDKPSGLPEAQITPEDAEFLTKAWSKDTKPQRMEYKVLREAHPDRLADEVNTHLDAGWEPQGGVAVVVFPGDGEYAESQGHYQAMIRRLP